MPTLRNALRAIRRSQPFNSIATSALRRGFRAVHIDPGLVSRKLRRVGLVEDRLPNGRTLRLWTQDDDLIPNEVFWRGWCGFEPETMVLFFHLASRARVTMDVGAHVGLFALVAGHASPASRVYAFEALPAVCERLRQNVERNGLTNVEVVGRAVGAVEKTAEFFYSTGIGLPGESSLRRDCTEQFMRFSSEGEIAKTEVQVISLDSFAREKGIIGVDLVKIDTEGTEPQVLRGMAEILARSRPAIVCEVLRGFDTERELEEVLAPYGYAYYLLGPLGPERRSRIEGQPEDRWGLRNWLFTTLSPEEVARL